MLVVRALSLIEIIREVADARKIVAGKLDGRKLQNVKGEVDYKALVAGRLELAATYELDGGGHTVEAERALTGEKAAIRIDGKAMANPDVDLEGSPNGLTKYAVKYILQCEDPLGTPHEMRLYAYVNVADLP
ncbi:MAG: hypothetical protein FJX74_06140 [Armatimonadetes bacterium]|nr:hypothetical protein [Armatimonadota bacterium]